MVPPQRVMLKFGGAMAVLALAIGLAPTQAGAADPLPYPDIADVSHASPGAAANFRAFFVPKSAHDPKALMARFSRTGVLYIDATSSGVWPTWESLNAIFSGFLPKAPPAALSYPLRIDGDEKSAVVAFVDTPQLFGRELRILGAVSFDKDGRVIRWMDYWDGRSSGAKNTIGPNYPTDFHDDVGNATGRIAEVTRRLEQLFAAGDAEAAAAMFSPDGTFEDMALHNQILGRLAIGRYLKRALPKAPYGPGAALAHVVGFDRGGGYEWKAAPSFPMRRGDTAVELDARGLITRLTVVYDSSLLSEADYRSMAQLSIEP
ncbi:MAG TPA: hypothetical protein VIJ94_13450 [Caulobacteraceae bacterium]